MTAENVSLIKLIKINTGGGTQPRDRIDDDVLVEYAAAMEGGAIFPPITLFFDGDQYWLADGFHRFGAHKKLFRDEIASDVRQGTKRDAVLFSASANATHGLRRTNADKRRVILRLLRDPEWTRWSNREIARQCRVDEKTVRNVRAENEAENPEIAKVIERIARRGQTTYLHVTTGIPHSMAVWALSQPPQAQTTAPVIEEPITEEEYERRETEALAAIHSPFLSDDNADEYPEVTTESQPLRRERTLTPQPATEEDRAKIGAWIATLRELLAQESDGSDYGDLKGRFCTIRQHLGRHNLEFTDFISLSDLRDIRDHLDERERRHRALIAGRQEEKLKATAKVVVAAAQNNPIQQIAYLKESVRQAASDEENILNRFAERGWIEPKKSDIPFDDLLDLFFSIGVQVATHPECGTNERRIRETCEQIMDIAFGEGLAGVA